MTIITLLLTLLVSHAQVSWAKVYSDKVGPLSIGLNLSSHGKQITLTYTGHLFNQCRRNIRGQYEGNNVNVYFIFPRKNASNLVIRRTMGFSCQTPWNYNAVTAAKLSIFGRDRQLWDSLQSHYNKTRDSFDFELAFEFAGQWDSDYSRNYQVHLKSR